MSDSVAMLFEDAIACVAAEYPPAYVAMKQALGARRLEIAVDDEHFMLDLDEPCRDGAVLEIATDVDTLCALVHGERGVLDAALDGRLDVVAAPDDLVAAASAIQYFMQGALRCISMPQLLDRLVALRKEST